MTRKQKTAALAFATLHFTIIGFCASMQPIPDLGSRLLLTLLDSYSYISGSGYHYGFFAPGVNSQMRVLYSCLVNHDVSSSGEFSTKNRETTFRIHNIIEHFWDTANSPGQRRAMAASFALKAFSRCPTSDEVEIKVQAYVLPNLPDAQRGAPFYWDDYYTSRFRKKQHARIAGG